jgi:hypothetical protein
MQLLWRVSSASRAVFLVSPLSSPPVGPFPSLVPCWFFFPPLVPVSRSVGLPISFLRLLFDFLSFRQERGDGAVAGALRADPHDAAQVRLLSGDVLLCLSLYISVCFHDFGCELALFSHNIEVPGLSGRENEQDCES